MGFHASTADMRRTLVAVAVFLVATGGATAAGLLAGGEHSALTVSVGGASARAATALGSIGGALPFGYAFGAGMVSAVNPCGFGLLAGYLGLYLRGGGRESRVELRVGRALTVGLLVAAGFVTLFAAIGLVVSAGAAVVVRAFPWIGLAVGVALVAAGAWLLRGGIIYTSLGERVAARLGDPAGASLWGYFIFGVGYGAASLSCTLPVFLTVVGGAFTATGVAAATHALALYGLGMGAVVIALTLSIALFRAALLVWMRRLLPAMRPLGAVLLILVGAYVIYYWLAQGAARLA